MSFNEQAADYAANFMELLQHTKGKWAGKPFILLPWQRQFVRDVYGTLNEKGLRRYQYCYLEVPKKNGKSEMGAAVALFHLVADGEACGEIYSCASDRKQASLVYDVAVNMVEQNKMLSKRCKIVRSQKMIIDTVTKSTYQAISAEAYTKHGISSSCVIFDELHTQPNRELWDVMTTFSGDAREQPLWYVITTAGDDADRKSIGWEIHEKASKIISGEIEEPRWYAKIWGVPPDYDGDIYDEELWFKVNPSLGVTIDVESVRQAAQSAKNNPAEERLFRWLRLNQWISTKRIGWLPITLWDKTKGTWTRGDLKKRDCYMGLDLSSTNDLTAAAMLFPPRSENEKWRFFIDAWIPEDNMQDREERDHVPFSTWIKHGHVRKTPGECVDYATVAKHIDRMMREYNVIYLCADQWRLDYMLPLMDCELSQDKVVKIPQTIEGTSPAISQIERLMYAGEIEHEENPCGRWAFGNVRVAIDGNENKKFHKGRSIDRIDPIMALVDAMAGAVRLESKRSVYETRGLRTL